MIIKPTHFFNKIFKERWKKVQRNNIIWGHSKKFNLFIEEQSDILTIKNRIKIKNSEIHQLKSNSNKLKIEYKFVKNDQKKNISFNNKIYVHLLMWESIRFQ